jgi:hypothetical protein
MKIKDSITLSIVLCFCLLKVKAQSVATQTVSTSWGYYINTSISGYGTTQLQVTIDGQNSIWSGTFVINGINSWTPNITWNNVKLISYTSYNTSVDDVQAQIMSATPTDNYGGTTVVLKLSIPTTGTATAIVTAIGANAGGISLSSSSSSPYTYTMASSAGTFNTWTVNSNIGIGTINPDEKLSIAGNLHLMGARAEIYGADRNHMIVLRGRQDGTVGNETSYYQYGDHVFYTNGPITSQTEKVRIQANGNVGIGTNSPNARLDISSPSNSSGRIRVFNAINPYNNTIQIDQFGATHSTRPAWNIIGVSNAEQGLAFVTDNQSAIDAGTSTQGIFIKAGGNVGIGVTSPSEKLSVNGTILTKKIKVTQIGWSDYVFKPNYNLRTLTEVEQYIKTHQHLPDVPSEKEVKVQGIDIGETQAILLRKIEELTLYMIEMKKENDMLKKNNTINKK